MITDYVLSCVVDGTGGGVIETPGDHSEHVHRSWNSGLLGTFIPVYMI